MIETEAEASARHLANLTDALGFFFARNYPYEREVVWIHRIIGGREACHDYTSDGVCWCEPLRVDRSEYRGPRAVLADFAAMQRSN